MYLTLSHDDNGDYKCLLVSFQKHHEKAEMFKLNDDDEDLTHYGQTLSEIERFEEPNVSGSEDDEAGGQIGGW